MSYYASGNGTVVMAKKVPVRVVQDLLDAHFLVEESPDKGLWLTFEYEKMNDPVENALKKLAPYVSSGNVEFVGEDNERFRYEFDNGKLYYADGKVVYGDRTEVE